jgi:hypothetical protein
MIKMSHIFKIDIGDPYKQAKQKIMGFWSQIREIWIALGDGIATLNEIKEFFEEIEDTDSMYKSLGRKGKPEELNELLELIKKKVIPQSQDLHYNWNEFWQEFLEFKAKFG